MNNIKIRRIIGVLLTIGIMIFIFLMSAQNSELSSNTSGSVITFFARLLTPNFGELGAAEQAEIIASYQLIVRKVAHFSIYLLLGLSASIFTFTLEKIKRRWQYFLSAAIALLYAISDEIHQLYVSGRVGAITDVLIDFSGTITGLLILALFLYILKKTKNKKSVV